MCRWILLFLSLHERPKSMAVEFNLCFLFIHCWMLTLTFASQCFYLKWRHHILFYFTSSETSQKKTLSSANSSFFNTLFWIHKDMESFQLTAKTLSFRILFFSGIIMITNKNYFFSIQIRFNGKVFGPLVNTSSDWVM